ncbi:hypothetical protein CVIRNUC_007577 [Coccomyxa viridis]|uniref:Cyanocobalamin reductase (cyanide-eliminating) n=1 Tax=Coccomyxa viridis TaxID=1274662 RepID=A0AAV1IAY6_9CHLO|nr:hypothetical protein CVIRNUC_007577 [Coccomyxa viridis]
MATQVLLSSPRTAFLPEPGCRGHANLTQQRWETVLQRLEQSLAPAGFDIVHPLSVAWYNQCVQDPSEQLPASSRGGNTLAVLVGNTKNLWDRFRTAYGKEASLQEDEDPLDSYTQRCVQAAADSLGRPSQIFWGHEAKSMAINGPSTELQQMASLAGLIYWDGASGLSLHPKYGSWFALRAVLVFDGLDYTGQRPEPLVNPMSSTTQAYLQMASRSARHPSMDNLAEAGSQSPHLEGRRSSGSQERPLTRQLMRSRWQRWVAVRDAPCPGHPWRYCPAMLQYHYTGDCACLQGSARALLGDRRLTA